jgi:hypothetical protein
LTLRLNGQSTSVDDWCARPDRRHVAAPRQTTRWANCGLTQRSEHQQQREPSFPYNHHCDSLIQGEDQECEDGERSRMTADCAGATGGEAADNRFLGYFLGLGLGATIQSAITPSFNLTHGTLRSYIWVFCPYAAGENGSI